MEIKVTWSYSISKLKHAKQLSLIAQKSSIQKEIRLLKSEPIMWLLWESFLFEKVRWYSGSAVKEV